MDKDAVRAYSTALLNCSVHRRKIAACPLAFGEVSVKERIRRVMDYKKPAFWFVLLAVAASVVAAILLLTAPAEDMPPQIQETQPTESASIPSDWVEILALVDEIVYNPAVAASSNPYDYINAGYDKYAKILYYGDTAKACLLATLEESADDGLREYIMAAACAELTGFGQLKQQTPWGSGKEWLTLYKAHLARLEESLGTPEDESGMLLVGNVLGVDDVWMRIVAVEEDPYIADLYRYSYRFQYYDDKGQEWYLVEIHSCRDYKLGDFDEDGVVELFYHTDTQEYPYYICDRVGENLMEQGYNQVPEAVLDYEILMDRDGYYLYNEQWEWFLKDPIVYVREAAKRPEERIYYCTPSGIMPAETDPALIESAYQSLLDFLSVNRTTHEKKIVYRIMTAMEYTYKPEFIPGQINYGILFEKWGFTRMPSTEERNCYNQILTCFEIDPMGFVRGMAAPEGFSWSKDLYFVAFELAKTNCLYDYDAYRRQLDQLERAASTDAEKAAVALLRASFDAWEAPATDTDTLSQCSGEDLWNAFCYAPEQVLRSLKGTNPSTLMSRLWGLQDYGSDKLMDKGYDAVNRILNGDPAKEQKDAVYPFLLILEMYGGYREIYTPGQAFNYTRLFDKLMYSDAAFATNTYSQMYAVFEGNQAAFFQALTLWAQSDFQKALIDNIAANFAYYYQNSDTYLKLLLGLSDGLPTEAQRDCVNTFIAAYQKVQQDNN